MSRQPMGPRHDRSHAKLTPEQIRSARDLLARRGWRGTLLDLETSEHTLRNLLEGPGVTAKARDRIVARLDAIGGAA